MTLNTEQSAFIDRAVEFLRPECQARFLLLKGSAGTGKTYAIQELKDRVRGRFLYTAPTNKATKVIRETLTKPDYSPECKTIYSALKLQLSANGEIKEIAKPEEEVDLSLYKVIVVDEASMINAQLFAFIKEAAETQGVKFIFMGDAAQLPPVKELRSVVWTEVGEDWTCELTKVMRYDNELLKLATALRGQVNHPAPRFLKGSANDGLEGIWDLNQRDFQLKMLDFAGQGRFSSVGDTKAVAWRNVTVDQMNRDIRHKLFDNAAETLWLPDDRLTLLEPAKDLEGKTIGQTDDEGKVIKVTIDWHPYHTDVKCWRLSAMTDDNKTIALWAVHPDSYSHVERVAEEMAQDARRDKKLWRKFWEYKESFHRIRHGYATTAHKSQGSTYKAVMVDWRDILMNKNRQEAFRCLYVACTRAKKELYLGG